MPSFHLLSTLVLLTSTAAAAAQGVDMICMTSPGFDLSAGEVARARISSATVRGCQATLYFVDENFLPVHFNVKGTACQGTLEVELAITIPREVPNGEAYLAWVCAGDSTPSCATVYLTGGESDAENLGYTQPAVLSCVPPQSTLSTVTRGAATAPTRSFSLQSTVSTHSAWTSTITSTDDTVTTTLAVTGGAASTEPTSTDATSTEPAATESTGDASSTESTATVLTATDTTLATCTCT